MLLPGDSIQRVFAGEESYRLAVAPQIATGNFARRGSSTGSPNNRLPPPRVGRLLVPRNPGRPTVPVLCWPDAVLEGRLGGHQEDIHAIYNVSSNFLNQGRDRRKNLSAFKKVDFAVCHDIFLTPTASYCDVIFPAIPTWQEPPQDFRYPLRLLAPKSPHRAHSQGSNLPAIQRKASHALEMNPVDATERGICDGERVRLFNDQGVALLPVQLCADLSPGVVCLPEGVWVEVNEDGID